jgi:lipopolysaccharide transport system ATP-binding protein
LLKILSGITIPTYGSAKLNGRIASILDIGAGFHPELTGMENIFLNGRLLGFDKKEIDKKLEQILSFCEIEQFINEPVKSYSNGMYLRLAFSIVAHLEFDIYLLDEVMNVGDTGFRNKVNSFFNDKIWRQGKTILLISHFYRDILLFCNKTLELKNGNLMTFDNSDVVLKKYENSYRVRHNNIEIYQNFFRKIELTFYSKEKTVNDIANTDELGLNIYAEKISGQNCELAIVVKDIYNNVIFSFGPQQSDIRINDLNETFKLTCKIPPHIFNEGIYIFNIVGFNDSEVLFSFDNAGEIEVKCLDEFFLQELKQISGAIRPKFNWNIEN